MIGNSAIKILICFLFLIITFYSSFSQKQNDQTYNDSIIKQFESNKMLIPLFKYQIFKALSHYPELKNTKIVFKYKNIRTSLACRPSLISIFLRKNKRTYNIFINRDTSKLKNAILLFVPINAQIGVIGHELAHIIDYQHKSIYGIISTGFGYFFTSYKSALEKRVDLIAINHGLKKELIEFSNYVINESNAPTEYKNYKKKIYYSQIDLEKL